MAKYTCNDDEINNLENHDKINYNYYLLNYNVDKIQQVTEGVNAINEIKQPTNLLLMLKKPAKIITLLTAIAMIVIIIVLIIFIIWYYVLNYGGKVGWKFKKHLMTIGLPVILAIVFIIGFIGVLYTIVLKEIMKAYVMIPQNVESNHIVDESNSSVIVSENNYNQTCIN
jgi:energy-coupling factor transporter transmembrane protein EcfT